MLFFRNPGKLQSSQGVAVLHLRRVRRQLVGSDGSRVQILVGNGRGHQLWKGNLKIPYEEMPMRLK